MLEGRRARRLCRRSRANASPCPCQTQPGQNQENELRRRNWVQHRARFRSPLQVHTFLRMQRGTREKSSTRSREISAGVKTLNLSPDWEKPLILIIRQLRRSRAGGLGRGPARFVNPNGPARGGERRPAEFCEKSCNSFHQGRGGAGVNRSGRWYPVKEVGVRPGGSGL